MYDSVKYNCYTVCYGYKLLKISDSFMELTEYEQIINRIYKMYFNSVVFE